MIKDFQHGDLGSGSIRVLHVDDESRLLKITGLFLHNKGYNFKITPVLSAEQALERLEEGNFDVVVSDYEMPGMNGLAFLEEVRKKGNDIPFILLTGKGEEKVAMEAVNKGVSRYITKKVGNPNVLFDTLGQYIMEVVEERKGEKEKIAEIITDVEERGKKHPLILALQDRDWNVRLGAAEALGKIRDVRAIDPLIQTLEDEDEDVRKSAAEALGNIGGTRAIEPLIQTLKDIKRSVRKSAAEALAKIGEPVVEPLIHAMDDEDEHVRLGASWVLGEVRDIRATESLLHALKDENFDIQNFDIPLSAAEALGKIGDKRAVEPLIQALKDDREGVRWSAAEVLGEIGDKRAVEPLIHTLKDETKDVRFGAAWALGEIGDKRAVEPLIHVLKDKSTDVRKSAAEALGKIGEPALETLISALRDRDTNVQKGAAEALGEIGDKRAVEPLIQASKVENEDVRKAAEKALEMVQSSKEELHAKQSEPDLAMKMVISRDMAIKHQDSRKTVTEHREKKVRREVEEEEKLKPEQIKEIRDLHAKDYRDSDIAKRMGISQKSVTKYLKEERVRGIEEAFLHTHRIKI